ncbi:MAG: hypothetical protein IKQ80_13035 [Clostridia bacterium]|nr:hypothetical protein [Clostridia bacterium]
MGKQRLHCRIAVLAIVFLLIAACARAEGQPKKVTVMVYMCGSDLESGDAAATRVLGQMRASRFNLDEVNVVALLGGSTRWWSGYDSNKLNVVQVDGSRYAPIFGEPMDWASMGDPDTLSRFLRICKENFPAQRYILIVWDHGGGPNEGVCYDRIAERKEHRTETLTTLEMETALKNSPFADRGLDIIAFHACLMGSAEVATRIAPFARYMVASEEINYGIGYSWLKGLEADSNALETARRIVDAAFELNEGINEHISNVFSAIDLEKMPRLNEAIDAFFTHIPEPLEHDSFTSLSDALVDVETFGACEDGSGDDSDLVDLGDLVNKYRFAVPDYADKLLEGLQEAVVYCRASRDSCTGLSVYHPFSNRYGANSILTDYYRLGFSRGYTEYIGQFASILCGTPFSDWSHLLIDSQVQGKADSVQFNLKLDLTEDQIANIRSAALDVLLRGQDGTCRFACSGNAVKIKGDTLTGEFKNIALYAVDANGDPISGPLEYHLADDGYYMIPAVLSRDKGMVTDAEGNIESAWDSGSHNVLIACKGESGKDVLIPRAITVRDDATGKYVTGYGTSFDSYEHIRQQAIFRRIPEDSVDPMPPFSRWEIAGTDDWEADIDGSWSFRLLEDRLPQEDICVAYRITDSQSNSYSSKLFDLVPRKGEYRLIYSDSAFDIDVGSYQQTVRNGVLMPTLFMIYKLNDAAYVTLENVQINGISVEGEGEAYGGGKNGAFGQGDRISLSAECILPQDVGESVYEMTFDINLYDAETDELLLRVPVQVLKGLAQTANHAATPRRCGMGGRR